MLEDLRRRCSYCVWLQKQVHLYGGWTWLKDHTLPPNHIVSCWASKKYINFYILGYCAAAWLKNERFKRFRLQPLHHLAIEVVKKMQLLKIICTMWPSWMALMNGRCWKFCLPSLDTFTQPEWKHLHVNMHVSHSASGRLIFTVLCWYEACVLTSHAREEESTVPRITSISYIRHC